MYGNRTYKSCGNMKTRCFNKKTKKWVSRITSNGKRIELGSFLKKEDAIIARLKRELKYWGYIQQTQFEYLLK